MLLADIKGIFDQLGSDRIASISLVDKLVSMEDRPWPEYRRGKPLTPTSVARLLKRFVIGPSTIRFDTVTAKGYQRKWFISTWERYLAGSPGDSIGNTVTTRGNAGGSDESLSVTQDDMLPMENGRKPQNSNGCDRVTDKNPLRGEEDMEQAEWEIDI